MSHLALLSGLEQRLLTRKPNRRTLSKGFSRAAVLVPLVVYPEGVSLSLMRRTDAGGPHSGQVSFPGGRPEPSDDTSEATALRETEEEFGISRSAVRVLGRLDDEITVTGYVVTPVVGRVDGPLRYTPDPAEVEEVFEVPLSFFCDPANESESTPVTFKGQQYTLYQFDYEGRIIWGLTARIIHCFVELLRGVNDDTRPRGDP